MTTPNAAIEAAAVTLVVCCAVPAGTISDVRDRAHQAVEDIIGRAAGLARTDVERQADEQAATNGRDLFPYPTRTEEANASASDQAGAPDGRPAPEDADTAPGSQDTDRPASDPDRSRS